MLLPTIAEFPRREVGPSALPLPQNPRGIGEAVQAIGLPLQQAYHRLGRPLAAARADEGGAHAGLVRGGDGHARRTVQLLRRPLR